MVQSEQNCGSKRIKEASYRVGEGEKEASAWASGRLFGLLLEEGDEVVAVLRLLETTKRHLGAGDELLGVLEVVKLCIVSFIHFKHVPFSQSVCSYQSVLIPGDALLLVGVRVRVAGDLARLAAKESVKLGTNLVALALLQGVALCASRLEEVGTLLSIACTCCVSDDFLSLLLPLL